MTWLIMQAFCFASSQLAVKIISKSNSDPNPNPEIVFASCCVTQMTAHPCRHFAQLANITRWLDHSLY